MRRRATDRVSRVCRRNLITQRPVILWLRQNLRLQDNPALAAAIASGSPIVPIFILDDHTDGRWTTGSAARWWLHESLRALDKQLRQRGSRLILARGPALDVLVDFARETNANAIYWSRGYEPGTIKLERKLHLALDRSGVRCRRFSGQLLFEPEDIATATGDPFRVFTPFYKKCLAVGDVDATLPEPVSLPPVPEDIESDTLGSWKLQPDAPDWSSGLAATWTPGEAGALARLKTFLGTPLATYGSDRDRPGTQGTSRLSPHLHFGEISPRQVWHAVQSRSASKGGKADAGAESFLRELLWREFSAHLLFHWPHIAHSPFRNEFTTFPWREDGASLNAWQQGETGYPIVDAGMRELWTTGWMHNRVRMVAASFLVKHLLMPWQDGAEWFWDTLVDADLANNSASWQWVAGCGADAAPYFRIFSPVLQGKKFDAQGAYVKRWLPELSKLPRSHIHSPWTASKKSLEKAGVALGETYPEPIVDHKVARERALAAFKTIGKKEPV